jgi:RNA polymerase sigma-70 factor (ECF subfamily)
MKSNWNPPPNKHLTSKLDTMTIITTQSSGVAMSQEQQEQFTREIMPFLDTIWQTAVWLVPDEHDAETLVENTFFEAFNKWNDVVYLSDRKNWIFKILLSVLRKKVKLSYHSQVRSNLMEKDMFPGAETLDIESISKEIITDAIRNLPMENRIIIVLSAFMKFKYLEIAEIIGISKKTVSICIYHGYTLIRSELLENAEFDNAKMSVAKVSLSGV